MQDWVGMGMQEVVVGLEEVVDLESVVVDVQVYTVVEYVVVGGGGPTGGHLDLQLLRLQFPPGQLLEQ
jgi:hypothetical protein